MAQKPVSLSCIATLMLSSRGAATDFNTFLMRSAAHLTPS